MQKARTMSGVVVGQGKDGAFHFFTDGGVFDSKGELLATAQKTHMISHMPAALTILGPRAFAGALYGYAATCATFDHLIDTVVWALGSYEALIKKGAEQDGMSPNFQLFMAGYSQRLNRLAAFMLASSDGSPLELQELPEATLNPPPCDEALKSVGWTYPEQFDVERDGMKIIHAQRLTPLPFDDGSTGCAIGGFIQHTVVTRDQITTRIIHRWPDEIGKRIESDAFNNT
jgi:hypothetical protein